MNKKISNKTKLLSGVILLFSFFLGYGIYDPFNTNGLYFDLITVLVVITSFLYTDVLKDIKSYKGTLFTLLAIGLLLFLADLFYGYSYTDRSQLILKYFSAVIIFHVLSYIFKNNSKVALYSILTFSISCALIVLIYSFGGFQSAVSESNGRLTLFGENTNSISTRMSLSFIIILYFIVNNPLRWGVRRFALLLSLPYLFIFVIATGSRGSFIALIVGILLTVLFSKIRKSIKIGVLTSGVIASSAILVVLSEYASSSNYSIFDRFKSTDNIIGVREELWDNALNIFYDYPFGVGPSGYLNEIFTRYNSFSDTHNLFIYFLVAGGFLSLFLFIYFLKDLFIKSYIQLKKQNAILMIILVFMILIMAKTGGVITYLVMWYFLAFINSFHKAIRKTQIKRFEL